MKIKKRQYRDHKARRPKEKIHERNSYYEDKSKWSSIHFIELKKERSDSGREKTKKYRIFPYIEERLWLFKYKGRTKNRHEEHKNKSIYLYIAELLVIPETENSSHFLSLRPRLRIRLVLDFSPATWFARSTFSVLRENYFEQSSVPSLTNV